LELKELKARSLLLGACTSCFMLNSDLEAFICMFCGNAGHLDEFCFCRRRIEKMHFDYARNSYRDGFIDFPSHTSSHASPHFFHGANQRSYSFGS
jgi:hypothetical protein